MHELSIYIHFPYCELKCPYCDFNSHLSNDLKEAQHLKAWKAEIDFFLKQISKKHILRSVFFGGGTPSLMHPDTVSEILEYIKFRPELEWSSPEITLEANPSSSEYTKFQGFKATGINRLSIGIQSLNQNDLKFLGRKHNAEEAKNALLMAKEIFEEYSFDLIYCLSNQTLSTWEKELTYALETYARNHISAYTLTIEKGTPFFKMHSEKKFVLPENEDEFYTLTNNILKTYGFERYEISNYARNGKISKHNSGYWSSVDYLGVGAGAHGRITIDGERFMTQNFAAPEKYLSAESKMQIFEKLPKEEIVKETLLMNLRAKNGINLEAFKAKYDFSLELNKKHLNAMQENGLLIFTPQEITLTENGMNLANAIIAKLMP